MKIIPMQLTYDHIGYRQLYPVQGVDWIIQQFKKKQITYELAVRRLLIQGVQNPESYLRGCDWELVSD